MYGRTPFGKEGRMDYVLELSNIYKYYGSLAANKDVSLKVKKAAFMPLSAKMAPEKVR